MQRDAVKIRPTPLLESLASPSFDLVLRRLLYAIVALVIALAAVPDTALAQPGCSRVELDHIHHVLSYQQVTGDVLTPLSVEFSGCVSGGEALQVTCTLGAVTLRGSTSGIRNGGRVRVGIPPGLRPSDVPVGSQQVSCEAMLVPANGATPMRVGNLQETVVVQGARLPNYAITTVPIERDGRAYPQDCETNLPAIDGQNACLPLLIEDRNRTAALLDPRIECRIDNHAVEVQPAAQRRMENRTISLGPLAAGRHSLTCRLTAAQPGWDIDATNDVVTTELEVGTRDLWRHDLAIVRIDAALRETTRSTTMGGLEEVWRDVPITGFDVSVRNSGNLVEPVVIVECTLRDQLTRRRLRAGVMWPSGNEHVPALRHGDEVAVTVALDRASQRGHTYEATCSARTPVGEHRTPIPEATPADNTATTLITAP